MQKSKPQSKQAPFCTIFLHETFSLFQHQLDLFKTTPFDENQHRPEVQIHLDAKIKQDLNKNQGEKQKLNAVAEKENTR
jgi:hypothetical protein